MLRFRRENNPMSSARSIRRAVERKQRKLARKAALQFENQQPAAAHVAPAVTESAEELDLAPEPVQNISPARLAANRANAQLSTGPTSSAGKANSCLNAVKTALTGRTVLLPTDDATEYDRHLRAYFHELQPVGQRESDLVLSIAETAWRLKRIPALENAIFAQGYVDFADAFADYAPDLRPGLIELHIFLAYEKHIRNLQLQDSRLHRRMIKDNADLRALQQERKSQEPQRSERVSPPVTAAAPAYSAAADPLADGFVFSTAHAPVPIAAPAPVIIKHAL